VTTDEIERQAHYRVWLVINVWLIWAGRFICSLLTLEDCYERGGSYRQDHERCWRL